MCGRPQARRCWKFGFLFLFPELDLIFLMNTFSSYEEKLKASSKKIISPVSRV